MHVVDTSEKGRGETLLRRTTSRLANAAFIVPYDHGALSNPRSRHTAFASLRLRPNYSYPPPYTPLDDATAV